MAIMVHITYKGSANNAQLFTNEMLDSGIIEKIRKNPADTPTAKARWVLMYIHFQIYSKVYKTNELL